MKITLVTDSTCDIHPDLLKEKEILFAPLKVLFKETEYIDKISFTNSEFYEKMRNSPELPTTSQVNPNEFQEIFERELEMGNEVIGIFISSDLSGTYNSAMIAKDMIGSDRIHIVDSRTTSFSLAMIVFKAQEMINQGVSAQDIIQKLETYVEKAQLYGMLDSLDNLKKGGRLSSGTAMIGKMLNLKPIIEVKNGKVEVASKARGSKKGFSWMLDQIQSDYPEGKIDQIALAHANDPEKLIELKKLVTERFEINTIFELEIGSVVGTHTGEGCVGIGYFKN